MESSDPVNNKRLMSVHTEAPQLFFAHMLAFHTITNRYKYAI